jgi:hypothetical protein
MWAQKTFSFHFPLYVVLNGSLYQFKMVLCEGVYGVPQCLGEDHTLCDYMRRLLNYGAYVGWIQRFLVQVRVSPNMPMSGVERYDVLAMV